MSSRGGIRTRDLRVMSPRRERVGVRRGRDSALRCGIDGRRARSVCGGLRWVALPRCCPGRARARGRARALLRTISASIRRGARPPVGGFGSIRDGSDGTPRGRARHGRGRGDRGAGAPRRTENLGEAAGVVRTDLRRGTGQATSAGASGGRRQATMDARGSPVTADPVFAHVERSTRFRTGVLRRRAFSPKDPSSPPRAGSSARTPVSCARRQATSRPRDGTSTSAGCRGTRFAATSWPRNISTSIRPSCSASSA